MWYDVVCFLLGYWHDIGWKCISVSKTFALNPVGIVLWKLSRKLRVVSHLYFMRSHGRQP